MKEWFEGAWLECADAKVERCRLRKMMFFVLAVLALGLLLVATRAYADTTTLVYSDPQVTLRLLNKPCADPAVLSYLKPEVQPKYQESVFVWEGRSLKACWRLTDNKKAIMNVDEEGDGLNPPIPVELFRKDSGA